MSAHFTWQSAVISSNISASTKLVLLVIGARMNQYGEGAFPSYNTIAKDSSLSRRSVISHVDDAIKTGWLTKKVRSISASDNETNIYSIGLGGANTALGVVQPLHQGGETVALGVVQPLHPNTPVLTPQLTKVHITHAKDEKQKPTKPKKIDTTITEWVDSGGLITCDDPIWERAAKAGIPDQFICIAWFVFKNKATETGRKQRDWKANFRDAVMRDWLKLWAFNSTTGECYLTTAGKTAERELNG